MRSHFHYSFYVHDLAEAKRFYGTTLGCRMGREAAGWADFDFCGHELSLHLGQPTRTSLTGLVDDVRVPMPHFGIAVESVDWESLRARLEAAAVPFLLSPRKRFAGLPTEHDTMFVADPSGNAIEIKGFRSLDGLFVR
jgi:uncharacterized protein